MVNVLHGFLSPLKKDPFVHHGRGLPGQDLHMKYLRASRGLFLPLLFSHFSSPFPACPFKFFGWEDFLTSLFSVASSLAPSRFP